MKNFLSELTFRMEIAMIEKKECREEDGRMPYIYMVRCRDGSLYTGIAMDVERRMREHYHQKKTGAKYTRSHRPAVLEMVWETESWSDAAKLEYRIKKLTKPGKEQLIRHPEQANEAAALRQEEKTYTPRPELRFEMRKLDQKENAEAGLIGGEGSGESSSPL